MFQAAKGSALGSGSIAYWSSMDVPNGEGVPDSGGHSFAQPLIGTS